MNKFDTLLDIAFQTLFTGFEELLLIRANIAEYVGRLLCTIGLSFD